MAAYPVSVGHTYELEPKGNGRWSFVSDHGDYFVADKGADAIYRVSIVHPLINSTDRATLETFYTTNKDSLNTVSLGGTSYSFLFDEPFSPTQISASHSTLTIEFDAV